MTLILTCLTARNVYQVSDRRLTRLSNPEEVIDDERNKAVFVGRVSFGYTGLAEIEKERTDNWLARVISESPTNDMADVAERIRSAASAAFHSLPKKYRHHAFQGAGWFRLKGEEDLSPGIITIHNSLDEATGGWLNEPFDEFRTSTEFPSALPGGFVLKSVGVIPTALEKAAVFRLIRKCVRHKNATPATVVKALIISMRWLSGRHQRIGKSVLALSLPKHSVENWERTGFSMLLAGPANDSTPTFFSASPQGPHRWFGPHIATAGIVVTDLKVGGLPDGSHSPD